MRVLNFSTHFLKNIYITEAFIYEILDAIGSDFEYNEVQSVLEKFNYDQERIIDHFLKNKGKYSKKYNINIK